MNKSPIRFATRTVAGITTTAANFTVVFGPDPSDQRMMSAVHIHAADETEADVLQQLRARLALAMHHNLLNDDWSH